MLNGYFDIIKVNTKAFNIAIESYASNKKSNGWVRATLYRGTMGRYKPSSPVRYHNPWIRSMELGLFGIRETSLFINLILLIQQKWPNIIYYDYVTTPTKRLAKNRTPYFTKYFKNQKAASPLPTFKKSKLFANFLF